MGRVKGMYVSHIGGSDKRSFRDHNIYIHEPGAMEVFAVISEWDSPVGAIYFCSDLSTKNR